MLDYREFTALDHGGIRAKLRALPVDATIILLNLTIITRRPTADGALRFSVRTEVQTYPDVSLEEAVAITLRNE